MSELLKGQSQLFSMGTYKSLATLAFRIVIILLVDYPFIEYDVTIFIPSDLRSEARTFQFSSSLCVWYLRVSSLSFVLGFGFGFFRDRTHG